MWRYPVIRYNKQRGIAFIVAFALLILLFTLHEAGYLSA
jgi:hypothetical protein